MLRKEGGLKEKSSASGTQRKSFDANIGGLTVSFDHLRFKNLYDGRAGRGSQLALRSNARSSPKLRSSLPNLYVLSDLLSAIEELISIPPDGVLGVRQHDLVRILTVPGMLGRL